jgi:hypothetical protein
MQVFGADPHSTLFFYTENLVFGFEGKLNLLSQIGHMSKLFIYRKKIKAVRNDENTRRDLCKGTICEWLREECETKS